MMSSATPLCKGFPSFYIGPKHLSLIQALAMVESLSEYQCFLDLC